MKKIADLTVAQAATLIESRQLSPVELVSACLERIDAQEEQVMAWTVVLREAALGQAKRAEQDILQGRYLGLLHGIPYGAKDIYYSKGVRTAAGSEVNPNFVPTENAAVIERLEAAGAILLGKTTTTEYAFLWGRQKTRNPWNLAHTPGGSSAGSGAAVSASMVMFALGTQTVGSLLRPAAYNGLTCLKGTYGRISRYNIIPCSWSLDHAGALTKSVEDTAIINEVLFGSDVRDSRSLPLPPPNLTGALKREIAGMVVGVPTNFFAPEDAVISENFAETQMVLQKLGVVFKEVAMPDMIEEAFAAQDVVMCAEAAAYHQTNMQKAIDKYCDYTRTQLQIGTEISAVDYLKAQRVRRVFAEKMLAMYDGVDAVITPSTCTLPPKGYFTGNPRFSSPFTNAGLPAMTVPSGFDETSGLPVGLQITAPPLAEEKIIAIGARYQQHTRWHHKRPVL